MKTFEAHNIHLDPGAEGQVRATCPECSPGRRPEHQHERDLSVNVDEGTWQCHHCGWAGGLSAKTERGTGSTRTKPMPVIDYPEQTLPEGAVKFFQARGITTPTLAAHKIGFETNGKAGGSILFPRFLGGECRAIKHRTHDKRMWQNNGAHSCFYNADNAIQAGGDTLVITEGEIDSLSWSEVGCLANVSVPNGAPPPSTTALDKFFAFLSDGTKDHFKYYVLATDSDEAGMRLRDELSTRLGKFKCLSVTYPDGCKDANDVLVKKGADSLRAVLDGAKHIPIDGLYSPGDVYESVIDLYNQGLKPGLSTGYANLDKHYTVREAEMTIVTGIPSSGKSTFLDAMIVNLYRLHGWRFVFCSPENWPIQRHIASIAEKLVRQPFAQHQYCRTPRMSELDLRNTLKEMEKHFFFTQLQDREMKIDAILDVMQAAITRHRVKGIVLDPWNELEHHRPANISETEFISQALGKIRRFARLNSVHVWIVAHPTKLFKDKSGKYPVPRLYDVAGSAHFFNKTDNGLAIHRTDYKSPLVEVHVQKVRFKEVGKVGKVWMNFVEDCGVYMEAPEPIKPPKKPTKAESTTETSDVEEF